MSHPPMYGPHRVGVSPMMPVRPVGMMSMGGPRVGRGYHYGPPMHHGRMGGGMGMGMGGGRMGMGMGGRRMGGGMGMGGRRRC